MTANPTDPSVDRRARLAADAVPALLWACGPDRRFDWFNAAFESFTGRSAADLRSGGWHDLVHAEDAERCRGIVDASIEARTPYSLDYRLRRHDGAYRWVADLAKPCFEADGAWAGYVGSVIDIDERKRQEDRLADRARTLRLAERREDEFLSVLSHELRNPLAPIANAASMLRTIEHVDPVVPRLREILERQVGRLERLITQLIDKTRSAHGRITLVEQAVEVGRVVHDAVAVCAEALECAGHRLEIEVPGGVAPIRGDPARLAEALAQVIDNSIRYTLEPGAIGVTVHDQPDAVRIVVHDAGQGIAPDLLPHVLELFVRRDAAPARKQRTTGIGLTLAQRIVKSHGGRIAVASDGVGRGTTVTIELPRPAAGAALSASATDGAAQRVSSSAEGAVVGAASSPLEYSFKRL